MIHKVFAAVYFVAAILTAIPAASASKACRLGYKALCSFTPYGTVILLALGILHVVLIRREASRG